VETAQGDLTAALISYQASLAIRDRLAKTDPGNAGWQRDLAVSYEHLAYAYLKADQPMKAADTLAAGRAIVAQLVAQFPDWPQWQQDLAWFDQKIAALRN
jgi:hypothetical protein